MKILVAEALAPSGVELLRQHHEVDERIGLSAGGVPGDPARVRRPARPQPGQGRRRDDRGRAPASSVIGRAGVGVDNVDLDAATHAGITVVNAPTGNTIAAAEHTIALMFALARKVAAADASVRRGEWKRSAFTGVELRGKVLGIVGLGKIGGAIADRARAMEMTVLGSDPYVTAEAAANHGIELVALDELLERSDVVTLHVPRTKATAGMIGRGPAGPHEADRVPPQRRPRRRRRRGRPRRGAHGGHDRRGGRRRLRDRAAGRGQPAPRGAPNTVLTPHLGRLHRRGPGGRRRGGRRSRSSTSSTGGRPATPSTRRSSPRRRPAPSPPTCPWPRRSAASSPSTRAAASQTVTLEVAGELADHDVTPLQAAVLRGLPPGRHERAGQPRQRRRPWRRAAGSRSWSAGRPTPGRSRRSSRSPGRRPTGRSRTVAGTLANGEPRFVRLDDYWLDVAPAPWMLISHPHGPAGHDRAGREPRSARPT